MKGVLVFVALMMTSTALAGVEASREIDSRGDVYHNLVVEFVRLPETDAAAVKIMNILKKCPASYVVVKREDGSVKVIFFSADGQRCLSQKETEIE